MNKIEQSIMTLQWGGVVRKWFSNGASLSFGWDYYSFASIRESTPLQNGYRMSS